MGVIKMRYLLVIILLLFSTNALSNDRQYRCDWLEAYLITQVDMFISLDESRAKALRQALKYHLLLLLKIILLIPQTLLF